MILFNQMHYDPSAIIIVRKDGSLHLMEEYSSIADLDRSITIDDPSVLLSTEEGFGKRCINEPFSNNSNNIRLAAFKTLAWINSKMNIPFHLFR